MSFLQVHIREIRVPQYISWCPGKADPITAEMWVRWRLKSGSNLSLDKHQKSKYLQRDIEGYRIVRLFVCGGWSVFHCFHSSTRNWPYTLQVRWNTNPMQSVNMNYSKTVIEKHIRHFLKVHTGSWIQYYSHLLCFSRSSLVLVNSTTVRVQNGPNGEGVRDLYESRVHRVLTDCRVERAALWSKQTALTLKAFFFRVY